MIIVRKSAAMGAAAMLAVCLGVSRPVAADIETLSATQNPAVLSTFTIDFGVFGGPRTSEISTTDFELVLDDTAVGGPTATFASYYQEIEPLEMPNPSGPDPLSTGNLVVTIFQSSGGAWDPLTGHFVTNDIYQIDFDGDLSGLGIFSPVYLPGASQGDIHYDTLNSGRVEMAWVGTGNISGIDFSYLCAVNTVFDVVPEPTTLSLLVLGGIALVRRRR